MSNNRPLKFRAWHKYREVIRPVAALYDVRGTTRVQLQGDSVVQPANTVEVMQSTGLTDRNGVEIFEGDIVKGYTACGWEKGDVVFGKYVTDNKANEDIMAWCFSCKARYHALDPQCDWEVIGNLWQNPELISDSVNPNEQ